VVRFKGISKNCISANHFPFERQNECFERDVGLKKGLSKKIIEFLEMPLSV